MSFTGYLRADGKVGIRNHVVVMASVSCGNGVVNAVARELPVKAITHTEGCGRGPHDLVTTTRTLAGLGKNPNVAAVLVVGLGCEFIKAPWVASEIAASGKPVETLVIQAEGGSQSTTKKALEIAKTLLEQAERIERKPVAWDQIVLGIEHGGAELDGGPSRALGVLADWLLARGGTVIASEAAGFAALPELDARATADVKKKLSELLEQQEKFRSRVLSVVSRSAASATIEPPRATLLPCGGAKVSDVLEYGAQPPRAGLYLMDTPSSDVFSMSGLAAGGAQIIVHATAEGSLGGVPISPVLKVAANSELFEALPDDLDFDAGGLARGESADVVGHRMAELVSEIAAGRLTKTEDNGMDVFAIHTVGPAF